MKESYARLASAAAAGVVLLIAWDLVVLRGQSPETISRSVLVIRCALYALAAVTAAAAAMTFNWWREPIGVAWTLFAVQFLLLLVNYILRRTDAPGSAVSATLIILNLAEISAYFAMSRVLYAAGLGGLISPARRVVLTLAALAVALLLLSSSLVSQWQAIVAGNLRPASLVSVLSDVITFTLIAPLAMSTLVLRGGHISWIFGLLTISVFGWMVNGSAELIVRLLGGAPELLRTVRMAGIAIAALFNAAAAATQVLNARRTMKETRSDG
jgi:hypothetical protein